MISAHELNDRGQIVSCPAQLNRVDERFFFCYHNTFIEPDVFGKESKYLGKCFKLRKLFDGLMCAGPNG